MHNWRLLFIAEVVCSVRNHVPAHDRRYAGEVLICDLVARRPQFVDNLGNPQRVPHKHRIREQAEAACLVHDFFRISGSKLAPIGEKQNSAPRVRDGLPPGSIATGREQQQPGGQFWSVG